MTYDSDLDPEVLADLHLRDRTARERADRRGPAGLDVGQDPDGLSPALAALYASVPDPDVESWPCRGRCGRMIGVTQAGVDRLKAWNKRLAARRERPIGKHGVMWCPDCKRRDDELAQAQRRPHQQQQIAGFDAGKGRP